MNILVTGGAGFIGSNFVKHMLSKHDYQIVVLDLLTYAGHPINLQGLSKDSRYHFVKGDIRDRSLLKRLFDQYGFDAVINFAAESHVDRSIENSEVFLCTNILGTQVLLEAAKNHWKVNATDNNCRKYKSNAKFIQISTDEVYGTLGKSGLFTEETNLSPNSPYSASKASADLLVRAYFKTYGLPIIITRCSNNYGPYQFPEKLIPRMIIQALKEKALPIYGDGKQVRDWLHVEDHCAAIDIVLHKGRIGEVYNIGGNNEKENIEVVKKILNVLGKSEELIDFVDDRLGHDKRYAIDNSKITSELGWVPFHTFEKGLELTIEWYVTNADWLKTIEDRTEYGTCTNHV